MSRPRGEVLGWAREARARARDRFERQGALPTEAYVLSGVTGRWVSVLSGGAETGASEGAGAAWDAAWGVAWDDAAQGRLLARVLQCWRAQRGRASCLLYEGVLDAQPGPARVGLGAGPALGARPGLVSMLSDGQRMRLWTAATGRSPDGRPRAGAWVERASPPPLGAGGGKAWAPL